GSRTAEPDFGSNKFALLFSAEEEKDSSDVDEEPDSMDLMTPPGKRILRERPVKPSTKTKEMHWHSTSRGWGNRGRGNRGGRASVQQSRSQPKQDANRTIASVRDNRIGDSGFFGAI
ncbi:unnamed protein product, partial [Brassica rapa]